MRKKILLFFSAAMLSVFPSLARDFEYTDEGGQTLIYTVLDEDAKTCETKQGSYDSSTKTATPGNSVSGKLVIPSLVSDGESNYTVTEIGTYGFSTCEITEVEFPNTLLIINNYAFQDCPLKDFILPLSMFSVTAVKPYAFYGCPIVKYAAMTSMDLSGLSNCIIYAKGDIVENGIIYSADSSELKYASSALEGEISLPDGLTSIGKSAFSGCSGLTSIIIPPSVTSVGSEAFSNCTGLVKSAYPNKIKRPFNHGDCISYNPDGAIVEDGWVYGPNKKSIYFAPYDLKGEYVVPESVASIGDFAFYNCDELTSVTIPGYVTEIGYQVFKGCKALSNLVLEDSEEELSFDIQVFDSCPIAQIYLGRNIAGGTPFRSMSDLESVTIGASVKSIQENAFSGCSKFTSVTIPGSVTEIGHQAFSGCRVLSDVVFEDAEEELNFGNSVFDSCPIAKIYLGRNTAGGTPFRSMSDLESVTIGASVKYIQRDAFYGCTGLTSISLPEGVTSIGAYAFFGCSGLTSISLPDGLTSIGAYAFRDCSALSSISFPDGLTSIGDCAFYDCSGLISISFPDGLTSIGDHAFYDCSGLTSISFPDGLTSIGEWAFYDCSGFTSVAIPASVTKIGRYAFSKCNGLTNLVLEDGEAKLNLGDYPFSDCPFETVHLGRNIAGGVTPFRSKSTLKTLTIGALVTSIDDYAFEDCSELTSVILPPSVTSVGSHTFSNCSGLVKSAYPNTISTPFWKGKNVAYNPDGAIVEDGWIYGPTKESIYFAPYDLVGKYVVPEYVLSIGDGAFAYCKDLTTIDIPSSVSSIGDYAFEGCNGLTSIVLPPTVTSVGSRAFSNCTGLVKSAYPNKINNPFSDGWDCSYNPDGAIVEDGWVYGSNKESIYYAPLNLEGEYVVPESVSSIENGAFAHCKDLTTIVIPSSISSIGDYAFYDCSGLIMADFSSIDHLCSIEFGNELSNPIYYTEKLYINGEEVKEVNIPDGLTSISYTFSGCSGLTSITIPESVTSIGAYTFYGCNGLTSITIPQSVTSIGSSAFDGCSGLTSITIPQSVTSIGGYAFYGCNLESVKVVTSNPPTIGSSGFDYSTYNSAILDVPQSSFNAYLSTTWNNFKNIYADGYNASRTYEDGVFKYRLIENPDNREAILIAGDYSELTEGTVPQRFTDESDPANLTRYEVVAIGPDAFKNCTNLKSLSFNSRSTINSIGSSAFEGCSSLTSISFPNTVKTIEQNAFRNCSSLTEISLPLVLTSLGDYAFSDSGLSEINFNDALETIGANAFRNCSSLTEISLPLALTSLGDYAFSNSGLKEINFNDALETIGAYAFNGTNLTEVNLNGKLTSLAKYTFADCKNLKSVSLNDGLVKIGQYVFNGCSNLASISIPESVEEIGYRAFYDCTSLKTAEFASVADVCKIKFENAYSNPIYYAKKLHINGEEVTELEIPQTVTEIGDYAFYNCSSLTKVVIPNSVTSLGGSAFYSCSGLTDVTVGNSLNEISNQFDGCTSLKSLTLADGVNPIDLSGLDITSNLTSLYMGREILNANGFSKLETLEVGNAVEKIKDSEFSGCGYLASLTLGGGLTSIGESAFANCVKLAEVVVPQNVETIGASAFAGNTSLSEITMGYAVKTIGEKAFDGCPASIVRITAQTPPTAPNNTFSNYTGKLWLQDPGDNSVIDAYYDAYTCWDRFDSYAMIVATDIKYEGDQTLVGNAGDTFSLRATLEPADVTLPQIFWYSTNPAVATVDANGLVTLQKSSNEVAALAEGEDYAECKIIGESLYADGPKVEITVNNLETGVDIISGGDFSNNNGAIDYDSPVEVFTLNGMRVASSMENLAPGIYVIRQGSKVEKRMVK